VGPTCCVRVEAGSAGRVTPGLGTFRAAEVLDGLSGRYGSLQPFGQVAAAVPGVAPGIPVRDCPLLLEVGVERLAERRERDAEFVHAMANPADQTFAGFSLKLFNRRRYVSVNRKAKSGGRRNQLVRLGLGVILPTAESKKS
jgi:hypothetical protein